jgi:hypothetical protein
VSARIGLAGMMIEPASMGRTGFGAMSGGELMMGIGSAGAAGSAIVVAVAASRTLRARSTVSPGVAGTSCKGTEGSEVGILLSDVEVEVHGADSHVGGSGRHSRLDFWHVGQTQSRDLYKSRPMKCVVENERISRTMWRAACVLQAGTRERQHLQQLCP